CTPMAQSAWSLAAVKKTRRVACCQKAQPAGTTPSKGATPAGAASGKAIATGARVSCSALDNCAESLALFISDRLRFPRGRAQSRRVWHDFIIQAGGWQVFWLSFEAIEIFSTGSAS